MPRTRPPYPAEYRAPIIVLARADRSVADLAREFEPRSYTTRGWLQATDAGGGAPVAGDRLTADERDELRRLRRENRQLRQERDILSKDEPVAHHWSE